MARRDRRVGVPALLLVLLLLCVVSSVFSGPSGGASTPEGAVLQLDRDVRILAVHPGPENLVGCLHLCLFSGDSPSAVVFYTVQSDGQRNVSIGTALAGQYSNEWHVLSDGQSGGDPEGYPFEDLPITFFIYRTLGGNPIWMWGIREDEWVWLGGQAHSPEVRTVEATLATGEVLRDPVSKGTFSIIANATSICRVRALDEQQRILAEAGPTHPMLGSSGQCTSQAVR